MKSIKVWGHWAGPNPWKVCIILQELGLTYDYNIVEFAETKQESYLSVNPFGKLPTIEDPNTGIKSYETGAIILYLINHYDEQEKISYSSFPQKFQCIQWLMYQVSVQGPYFGQLTWFGRGFHKENFPSAIERYTDQMLLNLDVLERTLEHSTWLVGERCTFADLSLVTWSYILKGTLQEMGKADIIEKYPRYIAWLAVMESRGPVRRCLDEIALGRAGHGLPP